MGKKETRAWLLSESAMRPILLASYPDLVRTNAGDDFYVGQRCFVVDSIMQSSDTVLHVYLRPKQEPQES